MEWQQKEELSFPSRKESLCVQVLSLQSYRVF